jgi:hypothetical protein
VVSPVVTVMMTGAMAVNVFHVAVTVPMRVPAAMGVLAALLLVTLVTVAIVSLMPPVVAAAVMGALLIVARSLRLGLMTWSMCLLFALGFVIVIDGFADKREGCDAKECGCDGVIVALLLGALSVGAVAGLGSGG